LIEEKINGYSAGVVPGFVSVTSKRNAETQWRPVKNSEGEYSRASWGLKVKAAQAYTDGYHGKALNMGRSDIDDQPVLIQHMSPDAHCITVAAIA